MDYQLTAWTVEPVGPTDMWPPFLPGFHDLLTRFVFHSHGCLSIFRKPEGHQDWHPKACPCNRVFTNFKEVRCHCYCTRLVATKQKIDFETDCLFSIDYLPDKCNTRNSKRSPKLIHQKTLHRKRRMLKYSLLTYHYRRHRHRLLRKDGNNLVKIILIIQIIELIYQKTKICIIERLSMQYK